MTLPLYQGAQHPQPSAHSHRGLWFERFADLYSGPTWEVEDQRKQEWLEEISSGDCGDDAQLRERAWRTLDLVTALGGRARVFRVCWRFVTGLGLQHPLENGFAWHPTLGVPYLPGSGLKGLLGAWLATSGEPEDEERRRSWLGTRDPGDTEAPERAGDLLLFDALPIKTVNLKPDVMTPHFGKWYERGQDVSRVDQHDRIPGDWHEPVPVPFLTVERALFLIAVAPRPRAVADLDLNLVLNRVSQALDLLGAGAKTAVSYGRLREAKEPEQKLVASHRTWVEAGRPAIP